MKFLIYAMTFIASATPVSGGEIVESVDLNGYVDSSQGGYAAFSRLNRAGAKCKIEVVIFGEIGQLKKVFLFNKNLVYAAYRTFRYNKNNDSNAMILQKYEDLSNNEAKKYMTKEFQSYKSMFSRKLLNSCN